MINTQLIPEKKRLRSKAVFIVFTSSTKDFDITLDAEGIEPQRGIQLPEAAVAPEGGR
jgi:hypothetical protein